MTTTKQERSEKCDDHISTAIPDLTLAEGSAGTPDTAKSPVQHKTYLLGFMPQSEVIAMLVGDLGLDANLARLQEVWMPRVQSATDLQANPFILDDDAHALAVQPIHWQSDSVRDAAIDHLASLRHWGTTKVELAMVRIDDLIVLQSNVTLERAHRLVAHLGPNPSFDDLLALSLGRGRPRTNIEHRWIGPNTLLFSSKDHDVRALQAEIRDVDGKRALVMPFGGGEPAIHCVRVYDYVRLGDGSLVRRWSLTLQNGFHRLYALRRARGGARSYDRCRATAGRRDQVPSRELVARTNSSGSRSSSAAASRFLRAVSDSLVRGPRDQCRVPSRIENRQATYLTECKGTAVASPAHGAIESADAAPAHRRALVATNFAVSLQLD